MNTKVKRGLHLVVRGGSAAVSVNRDVGADDEDTKTSCFYSL